MKSIFKYYSQIYNKGLVLFDAPTGIGKTTAAIDFIIDFLNDSSFSKKEKIIYITNLKTNLPYKDLRNKISEEYFDENCVVIKPFYEMILDANNIFFNAPECVQKKKEYKELKKNIESINRLTTKNLNEDLRSYVKNLINQTQTTLEPSFRRQMHLMLKYDSSSFDIVSKWLDDIYLTKRIQKAKIIFMSTKRFLSPIDTFEETYLLYQKEDLIKKSIFIFDEFDSTKQIFLDHIIKKGIKNDINLVSIVSSVYSQINTIDFSSLLNNMDITNNSPEGIIEKNKSAFEKLYSNYGMKYPLQQKEISRKQTFIFNEETKRYFPKKASYFCEFDEKENKYNIVNYKNDENSKQGFYLTNYIRDLSYILSYFANGVTMLSNNIFQNKSDPTLTKEETINSVLSYFQLNKEYKDFFYNKSLYNTTLTNNEASPKLRLFFQHGFSIISVEESSNHLFNSYLRYFNFDTTPEQIMFELCNNSLVFALSATASINSTICNYNLNFLEAKLDQKIYRLDEEQQQLIKNRLLEKEKCFNTQKSKVIIHSIDNTKTPYNKKLDNEIYELDPRFLKNINFKKKYYKDLVLNIQLCYQELSSKNIYSFIMFFNKFEMDDIKIDMLNQALNYDPQIKIFELRSESFNEEFKNIKNWLKERKKALVYTTYNTLGTGKNIQYEIPDILKEKFYFNPDAIEKDFDAIYLTHPTYLLENLGELSKLDIEEKLYSISNAFFQIEYLYKNESISEKEKDELINLVFDYLDGTNKKEGITKTLDYSFNVAKIIIQAIGRICRTKNKSENIHIYIENQTLMELSYIKNALKDNLLNFEFKELLKACKNSEKAIKCDIEILNKINKDSSKFLFYYYNKNHEWTKEDIKEWKALREYVLKYPTDNCLRNENQEFLKYYYKFDEKINKYYHDLDYQRKIHKLLSSYGKKLQEVSDKYAKLDILMENPSLQQLFSQKKYAKFFLKNKFIMSPIIFKSVYLGALGEVCGKCILEEILDIKLTDVDDEHFEYFDFVYNDFYFDFKHWIYFRTSRAIQIPKIEKKLEELNGKKVFIINLVADSTYYRENIDHENKIIEIPCLLDSQTSQLNNDAINLIDSIIKTSNNNKSLT